MEVYKKWANGESVWEGESMSFSMIFGIAFHTYLLVMFFWAGVLIKKKRILPGIALIVGTFAVPILIFYSYIQLDAPDDPSELKVKRVDKGVEIHWGFFQSLSSSQYSILVVENSHQPPVLSGDILIALQAEAIQNDFKFYTELAEEFLQSEYYDKNKSYYYYLIPGDYEGLIQSDSKMYFIYLYNEWMGPTCVYWIKELEQAT